MERLAALNYRYYARDVCKLLLGTVLQTAAYAFVMVPLRVVNGGVTSFSLVLHGVTGLDVVVLANILLMFLVVLAWLGLGRECMVKSLLGCVFYAWSFSLFLASIQFHQTMIMITHNEQIAQLADRVVRIADGKIVGRNSYAQ